MYGGSYNLIQFQFIKLKTCVSKIQPSSETQGQLVGARGNKSGKEMKRRMFTCKQRKVLKSRLFVRVRVRAR